MLSAGALAVVPFWGALEAYSRGPHLCQFPGVCPWVYIWVPIFKFLRFKLNTAPPEYQ